MHEPPPDVSDRDVLRAVRAGWDDGVVGVDYLPVGFGAHHWRASGPEGPRWFVTLDHVDGVRRTLASLEAAYRGAARLAEELPFVHAGMEPYAIASGDAALSVTPWLEGSRPERLDPDLTGSLLRQLHATTPPPGLPRWQPLVGPDLAERLGAAVENAWSDGPLGERARTAIAGRLGAIAAWTARYHQLAEVASTRAWVATHGEPHERNQLVTEHGVVLIDWESLKLAPAERDLRTLDAGDPLMLELFDLEWRLDEVDQYAAWFQRPHQGSGDDRTALQGLLEKLD